MLPAVGVKLNVNVTPVADSAELAKVPIALVPPTSVAVHQIGDCQYGVGKVYVIVGDAPCPVPLLVIVNWIGAFAPESAVTAAVEPHPALKASFAAVTAVPVIEHEPKSLAVPVNDCVPESVFPHSS